MKSDSHTKVVMRCVSVSVAMFLTLQYFFKDKPNAYEVMFNNKVVAYVVSKQNYYDAENEINKELKDRYSNLKIKENVLFKETYVPDNYIEDKYMLKHILKSNLSIRVPAVLMKSDGKEVAVLANEKEIIEVLNKVKEEYKKGNNGSEVKLANNITQIKEQVPLNRLNTVEEAYNNCFKKEGKPLVEFITLSQSLNNSKEQKNLSRGGNSTALLMAPIQGVITSSFGSRWGVMHNGLDIGANYGVPIKASFDGIVKFSGWEDGYGKVVKIDHGDEVETVYGHCSEINVETGEKVKKGDTIAKVGSTGRSTGPHVHFEVRIKGVPQDPIEYIK